MTYDEDLKKKFDVVIFAYSSNKCGASQDFE